MKTGRRPSGERVADRGSVTVYFAVMAVAVLGAAGLAIDGGRKLAALSAATDIADNAARNCAQAIDPASMAEGHPRLDSDQGKSRGEAVLAAAGVSGRVTVTGPSCVVTVTETASTVFLPGPFTVSSTQQAKILVGLESPRT